MTETAALRGSEEPLARAYDVALLDLDGVVYVGPEPVSSAPPALAAVRREGMRLAFVTNNASRTAEEVAERLRGYGVPATADEVVTSAQAAAHLLADRLAPGSRVLVVGTAALADEVLARGLTPVPSVDEEPVAVVQGYDPDVCYPRLAEAALAVRRGALWVATNDDSTMPSPRGLLPGNGALVALVRTATGAEPLVAGKPELPLHREAVRRAEARRPLVVGDRLDTDVEGAVRAGTPALLVLTGVTDVATLLAAPLHARPSYLGRDLGALLAAHPPVTVDRRSTCCGPYRAVQRDGRVQVARVDGSEESPDGLDELRAACVLAWECRDQGQQVDVADDDLRRLARAVPGTQARPGGREASGR